jgi:hypothetical protein
MYFMFQVLALLSSAGEIIFINATHATFVSQLKGKNRFITFSVSPDGRCISTITTESRYMTSLIRLDEVLDPPVYFKYSLIETSLS